MTLHDLKNETLCDLVPFVQIKQGVQGLQAFAFRVVTVNEKHKKPRFKRKFMG